MGPRLDNLLFKTHIAETSICICMPGPTNHLRYLPTYLAQGTTILSNCTLPQRTADLQHQHNVALQGPFVVCQRTNYRSDDTEFYGLRYPRWISDCDQLPTPVGHPSIYPLIDRYATLRYTTYATPGFCAACPGASPSPPLPVK